MSTQRETRPLPKFGDWDVNNPASADGFTVIFSKARDEKTGVVSDGDVNNAQQKTTATNVTSKTSTVRKWFCFG